MTIIDALTNRSEYGDVRVLNGDRWLCASIEGDTVMFVVNERKYKQKHTRRVVETENEDEAVRFLVGEK